MYTTRLTTLAAVALCASARADVLYGINRFFSPALYRINTNTGHAQEIAPVEGVSGLAANDLGGLYALTSAGQLASVNTTTGALTDHAGVLRDQTSSIAFRHADRMFYGTTWDWATQQAEIYSFDPQTGTTETITTVVGPQDVPMFRSIGSLQFDMQGHAFVTARFTDDDLPEDRLFSYEVDLLTGQASNPVLHTIDGKSFVLLTTAMATKSDGGFWASFQNEFFQTTFGSIDLASFDLFDENTVDSVSIDGLEPSIFRSLTLAVPAPSGLVLSALILIPYRRRR